MKAKVSRGSGAGGAARYILDEGELAVGDKGVEIVGGTCSGTTAEAVGREIGSMKNFRPDAKRHIWHCSLALPKGEHLESAKWHEIAEEHLRNLELDPDSRPWIAVRHSDTDLDHIHILTSRINFNKEIWHGKWEVRKAIESTQELEKRFGLTLTPGLDELTSDGRKKPTSNEIQMAARTGGSLPRVELQEIIDAALDGDEPISIFAFIERVEASGAVALPNVASTGKMNGFSFSLDGISFKASDLGKKYGWGKLQQRGVIYEQDRDGPELIQEAGRVKENLSALESRSAGPGIESGQRAGSREEAALRRADNNGAAVGGQPEHDDEPNNQGGSVPEVPGRQDHRTDRRADEKVSIEAKPVGTEPEHSRAEGNESIQSAQFNLNKGTLDDLRSRLSEQRDNWLSAADYTADLSARFDKSPVDYQPGGSDLSKLKPDHRVKVEAWRDQHAALMAPGYRLTLVPRTKKDAKPYNMGRQKDGSEIQYSAAQVEAMIPQLRSYNARGYDVYISPLDPLYHHLLIDDVSQEKLDQIKATDFQPCLIQKSSADNYQVIIKALKTERRDEQEIANLLVGKMNKKFGDQKLSGVVHPFRMAGFSNQKPGRRKAFTKIQEAFHRVCGFATRMLDKLREDADHKAQLAEQQKAERETQMRLDLISKQTDYQGRQAAPAFRSAYRKISGLAVSKGWEIDRSALDYRACRTLFEQGFDADEVKSALIEASPNVLQRHSNIDDYADRTIRKAGSDVASEAAKKAQMEEAKRPKWQDQEDNNEFPGMR